MDDSACLLYKRKAWGNHKGRKLFAGLLLCAKTASGKDVLYNNDEVYAEQEGIALFYDSKGQR
jgi:hypothetical protein